MSVKEIVVISGKGGTGKTTMTASLAPYYKNLVIADCDVDAPDLDILLKPTINKREDFIATSKALIDIDKCTNCGRCIVVCRFDAVKIENGSHIVKNVYCEGCATCTLVCKAGAISIEPYKTGEIFASATSYGEMIHARLTPGEEVSGRLVSEVRKRAKQMAKDKGADVVLIDGPPGIACNVISAITGSNLSIIVTEPTVSGFHDLKRVQETADKLSVKTAVIINKKTLSKTITDEIKRYCIGKNIDVLGEVPLSSEIMASINSRKIPNISSTTIPNRLLIEY